MAELPDFSHFRYPDTEGPTPADCFVFVLANGKTNKWNKIQFMGAFRNKDVRVCPISALAQYFFWRWGGPGGEAAPDFRDRRAWYDKKLLVGNLANPQKELSYGTQLEHTNSAFAAVGIESATKTQAMRGCGARAAELHGVSQAQVRNFILEVHIFQEGKYQKVSILLYILISYFPTRLHELVDGLLAPSLARTSPTYRSSSSVRPQGLALSVALTFSPELSKNLLWHCNCKYGPGSKSG